MPDEEFPSLTDTIRAVRAQLIESTVDGEDEAVHFRVGEIRLELEIAVSQARELSGGVDIKVLTLGAQGTRTGQKTSRISLTLHPVHPESGRDLEIAAAGTGTPPP